MLDTSRQTGYLTAALAALSTLPSIAANVLPRLESWAAQGLLSSGPAIATIVQGVSVALMAVIPLAIRNTKNVAAWLALVCLGAILFGLNCWNALDVATHLRASATAGARETIQRAAELNSRIAGLGKARSELPPFTFTSTAMLEAAKDAVRVAEAIKDTECKAVGEKCRKRMDEAVAAQSNAVTVAAQFELTEKAASLDGQIATAKGELLRLGPIPKYVDATAAKVVRILGLILTMKPGADGEVSEWQPIYMVLAIEAMGLLGPLAVMWAAGAGHAAPVRASVPARKEESLEVDPPAAIPALPAPAVPKAGRTPAKTQATDPKKQAQKPVKAPEPARSNDASVADIRNWLDARTTPRPDSLIVASECYESYKDWCSETQRAPVSLTRFGKAMKSQLAYVEKSRRILYSGIAFKGASLRVVAS